MILSQYRVSTAVKYLRLGGVIAYPTEGVWGLGCDPQNEIAVQTILKIKKRDKQKGLILIAGDISQLSPYVKPLTDSVLASVQSTWPGPTTWVLPASNTAPEWITGGRGTIAVRVTTHPLIKRLCGQWQGAMVSTSANRSGESAACTQREVQEKLRYEIDYLLAGVTLGDGKPSAIRHWQGTTLRER